MISEHKQQNKKISGSQHKNPQAVAANATLQNDRKRFKSEFLLRSKYLKYMRNVLYTESSNPDQKNTECLQPTLFIGVYNNLG